MTKYTNSNDPDEGSSDVPRPVKRVDPSVGGLFPYNNLQAILALISAVLSLIPVFGLIFGLVSLPLGFFGLRKARTTPGILGKAHSWVAITVSSLTIFIWGGLLVALIFFMPQKR